MAAPLDPPPAFELKDARLPLVVLALNTADHAALAAELHAKLEETPNFFDDDPVVVELSALAGSEASVDFPEVLRVLRAHRMRPAMAAGGNAAQMAEALAAGLPAAPEALPAPRAKTVEVEVVREVETIREVEVVREVAQYVAPVIVDKPLRSGQQVYAKGGDLIVLAAVNPGAEVIADGSIHVYAPLRGRAIAGSKGNADARIFTTCLEPELISIAGTYRTTETAIPPEVAGKPAQVRLVGDKLVMEPLKS